MATLLHGAPQEHPLLQCCMGVGEVQAAPLPPPTLSALPFLFSSFFSCSQQQVHCLPQETRGGEADLLFLQLPHL